VTCLGAARITVEKSGKNNNFFGNNAGAPGIATTYRSIIVQTHEFSLYSHLCIYVSILALVAALPPLKWHRRMVWLMESYPETSTTYP
jgi:hypothetical protein